MEHRFWADEFGWTPSQVRAESAMEMTRLREVHTAAAEGRARREKAEAERAKSEPPSKRTTR